MRKLLGIIVLGLLLSGNAYSKTTFVKCIEDKYSAYQRTFIFEINDRKKDIKLVDGIAVEEKKKTIREFTKNKIDFEYDGIVVYELDKDNQAIPSADLQYIGIVINRMTGKMLHVMNERENKTPVPMEHYSCQVAEPKF